MVALVRYNPANGSYDKLAERSHKNIHRDSTDSDRSSDNSLSRKESIPSDPFQFKKCEKLDKIPAIFYFNLEEQTPGVPIFTAHPLTSDICNSKEYNRISQENLFCYVPNFEAYKRGVVKTVYVAERFSAQTRNKQFYVEGQLKGEEIWAIAEKEFAIVCKNASKIARLVDFFDRGHKKAIVYRKNIEAFPPYIIPAMTQLFTDWTKDLLELTKNRDAQGLQNIRKTKTAKGWTPVFCATFLRETKTLGSLVDSGFTLNKGFGNAKWTALMVAAARGYTAGVRILSAKVELTRQNSHGQTALMIAVNAEEDDCVDILCQAEKKRNYPSLNAQDKKRETALIKATRLGRVSMAKSLLQAGADITIQDKQGNTAFSIAKDNDFETLCELFLKGVKMDSGKRNCLKPGQVDGQGERALTAVAGKGYKKAHKIATVRGDVKSTAEDLIAAAGSPDEESGLVILQRMVKAGADVNVKGEDGSSLLQVAVRGNNNKIVQFLIDQKADLNSQNQSKKTALYDAACSWIRNLEAAKKLINAKANPNIQSLTGYTPLMLAARNWDLEMVELLLEAGATPNFKIGRCSNKELNGKIAGCSALLLILVYRSGYNKNHRDALTIIKLLLNAGADINVRSTYEKRTALFQAVWDRKYDVAELLLKRGANPNLADNFGQTPLDIAKRRIGRSYPDKDLQKLLKKYNASSGGCCTIM